MMLITLAGPMARGKTLTRELLEAHKAEIEQKTGHCIAIREVLEDTPKFDALVERVPTFRVMRFKASGKWMDTFLTSAPHARNMQDVSDLLKFAKKMPKSGSMVVVDAVTPAAEEFFYPIEVKDESSSN